MFIDFNSPLENRARYYNPGSGRFLSEDPIGFEAGDFNEYRYVFNNSLNATDPTGQYFSAIVKGLIGIAVSFLPFIEKDFEKKTKDKNVNVSVNPGSVAGGVNMTIRSFLENGVNKPVKSVELSDNQFGNNCILDSTGTISRLCTQIKYSCESVSTGGAL